MKKSTRLLSMLLALALLLSVFNLMPLSVSAKDNEDFVCDLKIGETTTITIPGGEDNSAVWCRLVTDRSVYVNVDISNRRYEIGGTFYDSDRTTQLPPMSYGNSGESMTRMNEDYLFLGGKTYYLHVGNDYASQPYDVTVTITEKRPVTAISANEVITPDIENINEDDYYTFTPERDMTVRFRRVGGYNGAECFIPQSIYWSDYFSDKDFIKEDSSKPVTAGHTYILCVQKYDGRDYYVTYDFMIKEEPVFDIALGQVCEFDYTDTSEMTMATMRYTAQEDAPVCFTLDCGFDVDFYLRDADMELIKNEDGRQGTKTFAYFNAKAGETYVLEVESRWNDTAGPFSVALEHASVTPVQFGENTIPAEFDRVPALYKFSPAKSGYYDIPITNTESLRSLKIMDEDLDYHASWNNYNSTYPTKISFIKDKTYYLVVFFNDDAAGSSIEVDFTPSDIPLFPLNERCMVTNEEMQQGCFVRFVPEKSMLVDIILDVGDRSYGYFFGKVTEGEEGKEIIPEDDFSIRQEPVTFTFYATAGQSYYLKYVSGEMRGDTLFMTLKEKEFGSIAVGDSKRVKISKNSPAYFRYEPQEDTVVNLAFDSDYGSPYAQILDAGFKPCSEKLNYYQNTLMLACKAGETYYVMAGTDEAHYTFDVTGTLHDGHHWFSGDAEMEVELQEIPVPKPLTNGTGLQPSVGEWEEVPIDLPM